MKDVGNGLVVTNISHLVLKEIYGIYEKKNSQKKKINVERVKEMTERGIYKNFTNLDEGELNIKSNKSIYTKNNTMTNIITHCKGEKKRNKINIWI